MTAALAYCLNAMETGARAPGLSASEPPNNVFSTEAISAPEAEAEQEYVSIHFRYGQADWSPFFAFEKVIENVIARAAVGNYEGNLLAVGGKDGYMDFCGPSAVALFEVLKPHLLGAQCLKGIEVTLRYAQGTDQRPRELIIQLAPDQAVAHES
jgi:hypothetical protein